MKALMILHSGLEVENLSSLIERNLKVLYRTIGIDSVYASISEQFLDMFGKFPEVCFINNSKDEAVFGAYRGLRKLRGNNVLLIEGFIGLNKELIHSFLNRINMTVGTIKGRWSGIAFVNMRDLDYLVRSMEFNFGKGIANAFATLKEKYGIEPEYVELPY